MKKFIFMFILIISMLCLAQAADEVGKAVIIHAEGTGFVLTRNDSTDIIDFTETDWNGYEFYEGDIVNIEPDTFIEIQIYPSKTILKVSEYASFKIIDLNNNGSGILEILYGRIRVKSDEELETDSIEIQGPETASGNKGTDFGYDFVYTDEQGLLTEIYCFSGDLIVIEQAVEGSEQEQAQKLVLGANEMLSLSEKKRFEQGELTFEKEALREKIATYWKDKSFQGQPLLEKTAEEEEKMESKLLSRAKEDLPDTKEKEEVVVPEETKEEVILTGDTFKHFWFDVGADLTFPVYYFHRTTTDNPLAFLVNFMEFLYSIKGGPIVDFTFMFNEIFGLGLETGILYNTVRGEEATLHNFSIPMYIISRIKLGFLLCQLYGGPILIGAMLEGQPESITTTFMADAGLKLGVSVGDLSVYAIGGFVFPQILDLSIDGLYVKAGLGVTYTLAKF